MQHFGCSTSSECNLSHIQDSCYFPRRCLIFHLLLMQQSLEIAAFQYLLSNTCRSEDFQLPSLCPALVYKIILVDTNFAQGDHFMHVWKQHSKYRKALSIVQELLGWTYTAAARGRREVVGSCLPGAGVRALELLLGAA